MVSGLACRLPRGHDQSQLCTILFASLRKPCKHNIFQCIKRHVGIPSLELTESMHAVDEAEQAAGGLDDNPGGQGDAAPLEPPEGSGNAASALEAFMNSSAQSLNRQSSHNQNYSRRVVTHSLVYTMSMIDSYYMIIS